MNIDLLDITVRDLVDGYNDDGDGGVVGYGDSLLPKQLDKLTELINNHGGWQMRSIQ